MVSKLVCLLATCSMAVGVALAQEGDMELELGNFTQGKDGLGGISGTLHFKDPRTLTLREFYFDGKVPDAFLYFGTSGKPGPEGRTLAFPEGASTTRPLSAANGVTAVLDLPGGLEVRDLAWVAVWCRGCAQELGYVIIDSSELPNFDFPLGELEMGRNGVRGMVYQRNSRKLALKGFSYNGRGSGAQFLVGTSGMPRSDGVEIPNPYGGKNLEKFVNDTVVLELPQGMEVKELAWVSVYSKESSADYGSLMFAKYEDDILVGDFIETTHEVQGTVYIRNKNTLLIRGFHYDGLGIDGKFYVGTTGNPPTSAKLIPFPKGSAPEVLVKEARDATVLLDLPNNLEVKDLVWFGLWCSVSDGNYGHVKFEKNVISQLPDFDLMLGELENVKKGVQGNVYQRTSKQLVVKGLSFDGTDPNTFFYAGLSSDPGSSGIQLQHVTKFNQSVGLKKMQDETVVLELPSGITVPSLDWLSLGSEKQSTDYGRILFKKYNDILVGDFIETTHEVQGTVYIRNKNTLLIRGFHYDGLGKDGKFYVGTTGNPPTSSKLIPFPKGADPKLLVKEARDETLTLDLPNNLEVKDLVWFGLWCSVSDGNYGHVKFEKNVISQLPDFDLMLGELENVKKGVQGNVYQRTSKQLVLKNFNFDGTDSDTFFYVGLSGNPRTSGIQLHHSPKFNLTAGLNQILDETIVLELPNGITANILKWLAVLSKKSASNYGSLIFKEFDDILVGDFIETTHEVQGTVYIRNRNTLFIQGFHYDGLGKDGKFYVGTTGNPPTSAKLIPFPKGAAPEILVKEARDESLTLDLPNNLEVQDLVWFGLWCSVSDGNYGHVKFDHTKTNPGTDVKLGDFQEDSSGVKGALYQRSPDKLVLKSFTFGGTETGCHFYFGSSGDPGSNGIILEYPEGTKDPLAETKNETLALKMPARQSLEDITWFSILCQEGEKNLGSMRIQKAPERAVKKAGLPSAIRQTGVGIGNNGTTNSRIASAMAYCFALCVIIAVLDASYL